MTKAKTIASSILIFLTFIVLLEILTRVIVYFVKGPEEVRRDVISDKTFGWVHTIHGSTNFRKNKCGETVLRLPLKHKLINKFPRYSAKAKILFLGDSTTHAHEVSTGRAYYDIFEQNMKNKYSVYAAGVGGFGSLQEFMIIDSVYNNIKPDIVIWQLCGNDVANNVYELDNSSFLNNQRPRPYYNLDTDLIKIRDPGFWLFDLSLGFRFVYLNLFVLDSKYQLGLISLLDTFIALEPQEIKTFEKKGLEVLSTLLAKTMDKFPKTRFYGFSVDAMYDEQFKAIFRKHGAIYFSEFFKKVDNIAGTNCDPLDPHWNHLGNIVAGNMLTLLVENPENTK